MKNTGFTERIELLDGPERTHNGYPATTTASFLPSLSLPESDVQTADCREGETDGGTTALSRITVTFCGGVRRRQHAIFLIIPTEKPRYAAAAAIAAGRQRRIHRLFHPTKEIFARGRFLTRGFRSLEAKTSLTVRH